MPIKYVSNNQREINKREKKMRIKKKKKGIEEMLGLGFSLACACYSSSTESLRYREEIIKKGFSQKHTLT